MANLPLAEGPCPSCTALIDMWDGTMPHFEGLGGNLVVVAFDLTPAGRPAGDEQMAYPSCHGPRDNSGTLPGLDR